MSYFFERSGSANTRLRWTPECHDLFVEAVQACGGMDMASPVDILAHMDVPDSGITVEHVAQHLDKYRAMMGLPEARSEPAEAAGGLELRFSSSCSLSASEITSPGSKHRSGAFLASGMGGGALSDKMTDGAAPWSDAPSAGGNRSAPRSSLGRDSSGYSSGRFHPYSRGSGMDEASTRPGLAFGSAAAKHQEVSAEVWGSGPWTLDERLELQVRLRQYIQESLAQYTDYEAEASAPAADI